MNLMPDRYIIPLEDFFDFWLWKLLAAMAVTLFSTPFHLPIIVAFLWILDIWAGLRYSKAMGNKITTDRYRKAMFKATDYFIFISAVTLISKLHGTLDFIQTVAYVYVAIDLFISIGENLSGAKNDPNHPYNKVMNKLRQLNPYGFFDRKGDQGEEVEQSGATTEGHPARGDDKGEDGDRGGAGT